MPRRGRIDAPGALHHIIIRGIERKAIFKDSQDYYNFLDRFGDLLTETSTLCYAWALMTNHVHLLLSTGPVPLSTLMRRFLTGYAQQFNRRHKRHGHLFQNRYKSVLCEKEPYLLELVRYIHLNPIRAGILRNMEDLDKYPLSGHAVIMGNIKKEWQDVEYVLGRFGNTVRSGRKFYAQFVSSGIELDRKPELTDGELIRSPGGWSALKDMRSAGMRVVSDERILGSSDFVDSVLNKANEKYDKMALAKARGITLGVLIQAIADYMEIDEALMGTRSKQRAVSRARAILCHLAIDRLGIIGADIARELSLSPSAVSKLVGKGRREPLTKEAEDSLFDSLENQARQRK